MHILHTNVYLTKNIDYTHKPIMNLGEILEKYQIHIISNIVAHYVRKCTLGQH